MGKYLPTPTRVVTLTITAIYDESYQLDSDELVDLGTEALSDALPEGFQYAGSTGVVTSVSHTPER